MKNKILEKYEIDLLSLTPEIEEKLNIWLEASDLYYNDEPIMSDEQFDDLTDELKEIGKKYYFISEIVEKKIQTVDGLVDVEEVKSQMISLFKIKYVGYISVQEINKFLNPNRNQEIDNLLVFGPKLDGMAIKQSIQPNGKRLIITRGGQDVTDLLINHKDLGKITRPITHGELVIKKSVFNEKYSIENGGDYENPRNCIMGVLKQNPNDLDFIECTDGISPLNLNQGLIPVWNIYNKQINLEKYYFELKEKFEYQMDGIVVGYATKNQEIKDNYPLNIVAIKFKSPTAQTKVIGIEWTQKKSGNLTPVINVEPVKLDGSTISKVAGYNYMNLKNAHIGIGSIIEITKSGDIIPVVKKVISRSNEIPMPDVDYLVKGKHLYAMNNEESIIYKFILGLKLLQIDGIGPVIAEQIGSVVNYDIIELFNTENKPKIISILGPGAVWNNFNIFYQIKSVGLDLLIELLQFDRCGKTLSKKFAEIILKQTNDISGIDKNVLQNVCRGDGFKKINESMQRLSKFGIKVTKPILINDETISFEMTGSPEGMTKQEFVNKLKLRYPNSIHTTLTKNTKYLICDSLTSSSGKLNKARAYNSKIITYSDALNGKL
jgi:NAD-dependent DNA ligase